MNEAWFYNKKKGERKKNPFKNADLFFLIM